MEWQEYQDAVAELYIQAEGIGDVQKSITLPDKVTGQPRQVNCLITAIIKGHEIKMMVDANYDKEKININQVDGVNALAEAVGVDKAIIVCANGWTEPAANKARFLNMDLWLWSIEEAPECMNPDHWMLCPVCNSGLIIIDNSGFNVSREGVISWWLAGQCKECKGGVAWCQDCGEQLSLTYGKMQCCGCRHMWRFSKTGLSVYLNTKYTS